MLLSGSLEVQGRFSLLLADRGSWIFIQNAGNVVPLSAGVPSVDAVFTAKEVRLSRSPLPILVLGRVSLTHPLLTYKRNGQIDFSEKCIIVIIILFYWHFI